MNKLDLFNIYIIYSKLMKHLLVSLIFFLVLICQTVSLELHQSNTVVGNLLTEPYVAVLLSLVVIIMTMIWKHHDRIIEINYQKNIMKYLVFYLWNLYDRSVFHSIITIMIEYVTLIYPKERYFDRWIKKRKTVIKDDIRISEDFSLKHRWKYSSKK